MMFRDFHDELTDALLIHGAGTKVMLEKQGPIHGGAVDVLKNLVVESVLTPEQLAAKQAADAANAAAAAAARDQWLVNTMRSTLSMPVADCSVSPCGPLNLTEAETAALVQAAFPPGSYLKASWGEASYVPVDYIWFIDSSRRRRHVLNFNPAGKNVLVVDPHILMAFPYSVDIQQSAIVPDTSQSVYLPCFDEQFYLQTYPDVAAAVAAGLPSGRWHYVTYGRAEGRQPCPGVVAQPPPAPAPAPAPIAIVRPPPPPAGGIRRQMMGFQAFADVQWTVAPGDTLTSIAQATGICQKGPGNTRADWADCLAAAQRIADANSLPDINKIKVGQQLVVPVPVDVAPDGTVTIARAVVSEVSWKWLFGLGLAGFLIHKYMR